MTVENFVTAMAPAFAAGFAVQRLLEILDPVFDRFIGEKYKKAVLGLTSFILGLAFATKFKVLESLGRGEDIPIWLVDYLVTALIISGGTEGFNSVLKFLSYKKEEVKEAVEAESLPTGNTRIFNANRQPATFRGFLFSNPATNLLTGGNSMINIDAKLKASLKNGLKVRWQDKFIDTKWEKRAFGDYSNHLDAHRETVLESTEAVASTIGLKLPKKIKNNLQDLIALDSTPETALPLMSEAIDWAIED